MKFHTVKNLGLGALLCILMIIVFFAYQHSHHSSELLRTAIQEHAPARERLLQINERLNDANRTFSRYLIRDKISSLDVLNPLNQLRQRLEDVNTQLIDLNLSIGAEQQAIATLQSAFTDYLAAETEEQTDIQAHAQHVKTALFQIRQELVKLFAQTQDRSANISILLESCANFLTLTETSFQRYVKRSRLHLLDILNPVNKALQLLDDFHPAGNQDQNSDAALQALIQALKRYKSAVIIYQDEEDLDVGGANLEAIRQTASQAQEEARSASRELNRIIGARIQNAQAAIIVAGERQQQTFFGLAGLGLILATAISYLLGRTLSGRIRQMTEGTRRFSAGDLSYRLDTDIKDQLGELAQSFNQMAAALEQKETEQQSYLKEIARASSLLETQVQQRTAELNKAVQTAQMASQIKSEFLANMSHEIRTPINGVLGMAELLLHSGLNNQQYRLAETVHRSGKTLLSVINDILDFSKIEAGKLELQFTVFDLRKLIEDLGELFAEQARSKGLELVCSVLTDTPTTLYGDPNRLRQILTNLLGNAIKFTDQGEVETLCEALEQSQDAVLLRFQVRDTGPGIPPEAQNKIFESFAQADGSTTRQYGGTGSGLAISKRLVHLMDGEIHLQSTPNQGSTFWFSVRLEKAATKPVLAPCDVLRGTHALVVDDNATSRKMLCQQLTAWGIRPQSAADANTALEMLRTAANQDDPFHLALVDKEMPVMDGVALIKVMQADPTIAATHRILLSSLYDDLSAETEPMASHLIKPIRQSELYNCLITALDKNSATLPSQPKPSSEKPPLKFQGRILLAEDNPINQQVAQTMLELLGCQVDVAQDGLDALDSLSQNTYDLVLMDCQMPNMDGFETTAKIRQREQLDPKTQPNTIIALTANALHGDRERCLAIGMNDYLSKPFSKKQLSALLETWLPLQST